MACPRLVPRRRVGQRRARKRGRVSHSSVPLQVSPSRGENGWRAEISAVDVNCVVITINYRHAPEHVFPAAHDDALAGWRWATSPLTTGLPKLDLRRVAIGGLSAYFSSHHFYQPYLLLTGNVTQRRQPCHLHRLTHRHWHHPANLPTPRMPRH
jgi:hypothetical protein